MVLSSVDFSIHGIQAQKMADYLRILYYCCLHRSELILFEKSVNFFNTIYLKYLCPLLSSMNYKL